MDTIRVKAAGVPIASSYADLYEAMKFNRDMKYTLLYYGKKSSASYKGSKHAGSARAGNLHAADNCRYDSAGEGARRRKHA